MVILYDCDILDEVNHNQFSHAAIPLSYPIQSASHHHSESLEKPA